jgi:hypothetical protein
MQTCNELSDLEKRRLYQKWIANGVSPAPTGEINRQKNPRRQTAPGIFYYSRTQKEGGTGET